MGVAWGMHSAEELTGAGAEFVAIWPQELPGYLIGDTAANPAAGACAAPATGQAPPAGPGAPAPAPVERACNCGCSAPDAGRVASAGRIRRARRRRAGGAAGPGRSPGREMPGAQVPAELMDAARRILRPTGR